MSEKRLCHPHPLLSDSISKNTTRSPVFPDDLVSEILQWLPVKSLMRSKCVSKLWLSIIQRPSFAADYRHGFRGLLLTQPYSAARFSPTKDFFYLSLEGGQISHHHTVVHEGGRSLGCTGIVNGLVCFYCGHYSCLYNLATRESMELPRSSEYAHSFANYHLGFDPVNNSFKVLKICPFFGDDKNDPLCIWRSFRVHKLDYSESQIFTVGVDASWRRIHPRPPAAEQMVTQAMCINGALYWDAKTLKDMNVPLIAFRLALEKFEFVPLPGTAGFYYLPDDAPCLSAIVVSIAGRRGKALISYAEIHSYGDGGWRIEHQFNSPWAPSHKLGQGYSVVAILPDGKVVLFDEGKPLYFPSPFYLYEPVEKKFKKIEIWRSYSKDPHSELLFAKGVSGRLSYHEENIIPLNCLAAGSTNRIED